MEGNKGCRLPGKALGMESVQDEGDSTAIGIKVIEKRTLS